MSNIEVTMTKKQTQAYTEEFRKEALPSSC